MYCNIDVSVSSSSRARTRDSTPRPVGVTIGDMPARSELNAVDAAIIDELDEQIEWLWSEAIGEAQARLSVLDQRRIPGGDRAAGSDRGL